jgi:hypothetical protein
MEVDSDEYIDDNFTNIDRIDDFFIKHSNKIHDLSDELKSRFSGFSPPFLCNMEFHNLIHFFENFIVKQTCFLPLKSKINNKYIYTKEIFNTFYKKELDISYGIVFDFSKTTLKFNLHYEDWLKFCYHFTDKYELYK